MESRKQSKPIDVMNTLDWTEVIFTPEEKKRLDAHGGDLLKSGLLDAWINAFPPPPKPFSERVAILQGEYADLIVLADLPDPRRQVIICGEDWRYAEADVSLDDLNGGEALGWGITVCRRQSEKIPLSRPWFYVKIYDLCESFLFESDLERKFDLAGRLGDLLATLAMRVQQLRNATRGEGLVANASKGGQARSADHLDQRVAVMDEMHRLIELGHTVSRAAALAAKNRIGTSQGNNRSLWYRYNK